MSGRLLRAFTTSLPVVPALSVRGLRDLILISSSFRLVCSVPLLGFLAWCPKAIDGLVQTNAACDMHVLYSISCETGLPGSGS
jgi:hypothetical protein